MKKFFALVLFLFVPGSLPAADIGNLRVALEEDGVKLSFTLNGTFADEVIARIKSGLETSFRIKIRIDQDREFWFNRRVAERDLKLSCTYDNIASVYRVSKSLDGDVFESVVVDNDQEMKTAMSKINHLKILDNGHLEHNEEYILKVRGEILSRYVLLVVPWDIKTPWREKRFTFN